MKYANCKSLFFLQIEFPCKLLIIDLDHNEGIQVLTVKSPFIVGIVIFPLFSFFLTFFLGESSFILFTAVLSRQSF